MQKQNIERLTYLIGSYSLMIYLLLSLFFLTIASIIVQDVEYPKKNPLRFLLELVIMSIAATFPYTYIHWLRNGGSHKNYVFSHSILVMKFAIFHVLLQFSGFYTALFKAI